MNAHLDLILPPIIVGILIVIIITINTRMMESQVESRVTHEMQQFANASLSVLQEEIRDLGSVIAITDSTLRYLSSTNDTVSIFRINRDLMIRRRVFGGGAADTSVYAARLSSLRFTIFSLGSNGATMLRVRVESRSTGAEQLDNSPTNFLAFAERDFYLRNLQP